MCYDSYEDWYDNGPGSVNFSRACRCNIPSNFSIVISNTPEDIEDYFYYDDAGLIFELPIPGFGKEEVKVETADDMFYITWGDEEAGGEYEDIIPDGFQPAEEVKVSKGLLTWKFYRIDGDRKNIPVV